jgi:hypothetical protein
MTNKKRNRRNMGRRMGRKRRWSVKRRRRSKER